MITLPSPRRFSFIPTITTCGLAMFVGLLLGGCAHPIKSEAPVAKERPDPLEAFNAICNRAMAEDVAFFRNHMTSELVAQAGPQIDSYIKNLMKDLERCRAWNCGTTTESQKVILVVARVTPQGIRIADIDFIYDSQKGWVLGSTLKNDRPWQNQK